ncbi:hypothetical protein [Myxosarcina sp. GI1]|uniref:hypothetical protein n=1 Tax=Myxosarcina sp. GI1 TaxID=1541065 RepID=UPI000560133D|nr:hypothetical protein [Myxosarcina sp. GI1]
MKYPTRSEYYSAIRNPHVAFRKIDPYSHRERDLDTGLAKGKAVEKVKFAGIQDIWSASGSFAIAFKYQTVSPAKIWAVRCFYRTNFDVVAHYKRVLKYLNNSPVSSYFVNFALLEQGIRVRGTCYPILKMEWIEGKNLKKFIKDNLHRKNTLESLAQTWLQLANNLLSAGVAHGDLQHGNVFVLERFGNLSLKLIDYDSLYFERDNQSIPDNIKGLSDYQHPLRKSLEHRCLAIDFFPQLVIYLSILALAEDKRLWNAYKLDDREGLLFTRSDLENPDTAAIFQTLADLSPSIANLAYKLRQICNLADFDRIPSLARAITEEISSETSTKTQERASINFNLSYSIEPILSLSRNSNLWLKNNLRQFTKLKFKPAWRVKDNIGSQLTNQEQSDLNETAKSAIEKQASKFFIVWWQKQLFRVTSLFHSGQKIQDEIETSTQNSNPDIVTHIIAPTGTESKVKWNPRLSKSKPIETDSKVIIKLNYWQQLKKLAVTLKTSSANTVNRWFRKLRQFRRNLLVIRLKTRRKLSNFQNEILSQVKQIKKAITAKTKGKTWTTREVAERVERSVSWCHNQRYQYPNKFRLGVHYYKDEYESIQWTKKGIKNLLRLRDAKDSIPKNSLPTKVVSTNLGISTQLITRTKAKHLSQFIEGTHYHLNSQKHYLWTPKGIELLQQLCDRAQSTDKVHSCR